MAKPKKKKLTGAPNATQGAARSIQKIRATGNWGKSKSFRALGPQSRQMMRQAGQLAGQNTPVSQAQSKKIYDIVTARRARAREKSPRFDAGGAPIGATHAPTGSPPASSPSPKQYLTGSSPSNLKGKALFDYKIKRAKARDRQGEAGYFRKKKKLAGY